MYKDEGRSRPKIKCPCCRSPVRMVKRTAMDKAFQCVECKWESKKVAIDKNMFQSDLDAMHLDEKNMERINKH